MEKWRQKTGCVGAQSGSAPSAQTPFLLCKLCPTQHCLSQEGGTSTFPVLVGLTANWKSKHFLILSSSRWHVYWACIAWSACTKLTWKLYHVQSLSSICSDLWGGYMPTSIHSDLLATMVIWLPVDQSSLPHFAFPWHLPNCKKSFK